MPQSRAMPRPLAFLSHSSKDKGTATAIASALKERGIDVWIDHEQIRLGDSVPGKIGDGLAEADALLLLVSKHSVESRWCRAEYEPLLSQEIDSGRTFVIALRLDETDLPVMLRAKRYADLRAGLNADVLEELAEAVATGASYSRFERLRPDGKVEYQHSVLAMIVGGVLRDLPVSSIGKEALPSKHALLSLFKTVDTLIERFQALCDEIMQTLVEGGIRPGHHRSVYGSARTLGHTRMAAANRKLANIAADMRELAVSVEGTLPDDSTIRRRFASLLQVCATISVAEDYLVVEFGAPMDISTQSDSERPSRFPPAEQIARLDMHDSWDNSQKMREYSRLLAQLDEYRRELRTEIARLAAS